MRKIYTMLVAIPAITQISYGQNTAWTTSGNIGIGATTGLTSLLTIGSSAYRGTLNIVGSSSATPVISLADSRTGSHTYSLYSGLSSPGNFDILDQNTSNYRFTINSSGNIGIGTFAPLFKLQVESALAGVARFATSQTGNTGNISVSNGSSYGYGVMGVISGTGAVGGDVYALGYTSNANSSFTGVINWTSGGFVGIGTPTPQEALSVNGNIRSKQVKVETINWPDYVFKKDYSLPSLAAIENYIDQNHHLPEMPSEAEIAKEGINLGEMVKLQTKKIEELTLYLIKKQKQLDEQSEVNIKQQKSIEDQQRINQSLQQQINKLAKRLND